MLYVPVRRLYDLPAKSLFAGRQVCVYLRKPICAYLPANYPTIKPLNNKTIYPFKETMANAYITNRKSKILNPLYLCIEGFQYE
jgi:hypothetical protein